MPKDVSNSIQSINGTIHNSTGRYAEGSIVKYECDYGYERTSGNLLQECVQDAVKFYWSGKPPVCERMLFLMYFDSAPENLDSLSYSEPFNNLFEIYLGGICTRNL